MKKKVYMCIYTENLSAVQQKLTHNCKSTSESHSLMSDSWRPHGLYIVYGILQARILERVAFPFCGDLPNPGIEPRSPALQADSLPAEPQGKPKNTGVGSLSLLQQIFSD